MRWGLALLLVPSLALIGCGAGPEPVALKNRTFYEWDQVSDDWLSRYEKRYPPLDWERRAPLPEYIGVAVINSTVRLSRPTNWVIRRASLQPERRFIEYMSPKQYIFSVYERLESPEDPWRVVMKRYEEDVAKSGGQIVGKRVPIATGNAQGRAYVIRRPVRAAKEPFVNFSREILLRSDNRIVVVETVHQGQTLQPIGDELYRVIETLEVL